MNENGIRRKGKEGNKEKSELMDLRRKIGKGKRGGRIKYGREKKKKRGRL